MNSIGKLLRFQAERAMLQIVHFILANNGIRFVGTFWQFTLLHRYVNLFQLCGENTVDLVVVLVHERACVDLRRVEKWKHFSYMIRNFSNKNSKTHIAARIGQEVCGVELNARLIAVNFQISSGGRMNCSFYGKEKERQMCVILFVENFSFFQPAARASCFAHLDTNAMPSSLCFSGILIQKLSS